VGGTYHYRQVELIPACFYHAITLTLSAPWVTLGTVLSDYGEFSIFRIERVNLIFDILGEMQ
jgi:hypothetical protein